MRGSPTSTIEYKVLACDISINYWVDTYYQREYSWRGVLIRLEKNF